MPSYVRHRRAGWGTTGEEAASAQAGMALTHRDQLACEAQHVAIGLGQAPVEPRKLIVLRVGIVVAALAAQHLVACEDHRYTLAQEQDRHQILSLTPTQG